MIDLHTHSTASDGSLSPRDLIQKAIRENISALALTDHDTVQGLASAEQAATEFPDSNFKFIRGIEVSIECASGDFHLLGLGLRPIDVENDQGIRRLVEGMASLNIARSERNTKIVALMQEAGIKTSMEELSTLAQGAVIGRPHLAQLLIKHGKVKTIQEAFDKYLARGKKLYLPKKNMELELAINLIHAAGGLAVVAHPLSLFISFTKLKALVPAWKELGIDGLEAWHPIIRVGEAERIEALAHEHGLAATAGSDFHGSHPDRRLGYSSGGRAINQHFLEFLQGHF